MANGNGNDKGLGRWALEIIIGLLVATNLWMTRAMWAEQQDWRHDIDVRVRKNETVLTAIQANRFTAADGLEVWKAIHTMQTQVAVMQTQFAKHVEDSD